MKKTLILVVCALLGVLTASAQQRMVRVYTDKGVEKKDTIEVWRIDQISFIADTVATLTDTPDTLDFGLSVRWADRNLGAASPKDPGRLIGWGDTTLTNYSKKLQYFPIENGLNGNYLNNIYGTQYDVAAKKWDDKWHMPSQAEMQELIDACEWTWVNVDNDSVGFVGTLKTDETKTIFLPVTGYREGESINEELKANGYYWTGSLGETSNAWGMTFVSTSEKPSLSKYLRYLGLAIRPVTGKMKVPTQIGTVTTTSVEAQKATVTATLTGDLDDVQKIVVNYGTSSNNLSGSVEAAEIAGTVVIKLTGLTQNTTYYVKLSVVTDNGTRVSDVFDFTTESLPLFPKPDAPVDLGLPSGVKWSPWNMGSSSAMDVPNTQYARYGWGDPTGEVHTQSTNDYVVSQNSNFNSGIDIAGTQYDIARVKWGNGWRLPRKADFDELISNCTCTLGTYQDENNKSHIGMRLVSKKNGNSILLPAAGFKNSKGVLIDDNDALVYWISTNSGGSSIKVPVLFTNYVNYNMNGAIYYQVPIRPVYDESGSTSGSGQGSQGSGTETSEGKKAKAVDLGLSVDWADSNVGSAGSPNGVGSYICWGEISSSSYSQSNYSLYQNNAYVVEGLQPLPADKDAATVLWGGAWRIPTMGEWGELMNNCIWEENPNGNGYRIYKKDGQGNKITTVYIDLPISGYKNGSSSPNTDYCNYWTSTLNTQVDFHGEKAYSFMGKPGGTSSIWTSSRYYGLPIRPVKSK